MMLFERVKILSKKRGMSLASVNNAASLGKNAIYKWKTQQPGSEALKSVADVLGVSVDYLLGNNDAMHPSAPKTDMPVDLEEVLDKLGPTLRFEGKELTTEQKLKLYEMAKVMFGE